MQQPPQYPYQQPPYTQYPQQPYQQPGPPPKKPTHPLIIAALLILVTFALVGTAVALRGGNPLPATGTWTTTHTFTGERIQKTAIFSVSADWKILYTCTYQQISGTSTTVDGALAVMVYDANNTIQDVAVNARCKTAKVTGETEEHQGGQIYLSMNGTGKWTIQVQELK